MKENFNYSHLLVEGTVVAIGVTCNCIPFFFSILIHNSAFSLGRLRLSETLPRLD